MVFKNAVWTAIAVAMTSTTVLLESGCVSAEETVDGTEAELTGDYATESACQDALIDQGTWLRTSACGAIIAGCNYKDSNGRPLWHPAQETLSRYECVGRTVNGTTRWSIGYAGSYTYTYSGFSFSWSPSADNHYSKGCISNVTLTSMTGSTNDWCVNNGALTTVHYEDQVTTQQASLAPTRVDLETWEFRGREGTADRLTWFGFTRGGPTSGSQQTCGAKLSPPRHEPQVFGGLEGWRSGTQPPACPGASPSASLR